MKSLAVPAILIIAAIHAWAQAPAAPVPAAAKTPAVVTSAPNIRTVYVMPMNAGLDQHLADRITREHIYRIVTDPKIADAFLTERIGPSFEQRMAEMLPASPAEKPAATAVATTGRVGMKSTVSRGTVFLVEAKTRQVVWSDFENETDTTPRALSREAGRITKKLAELSSKQ